MPTSSNRFLATPMNLPTVSAASSVSPADLSASANRPMRASEPLTESTRPIATFSRGALFMALLALLDGEHLDQRRRHNDREQHRQEEQDHRHGQFRRQSGRL